jgi:probable FeS assembly SUF system protein SufT
MQTLNSVSLTRDCAATQIPSGNSVVLPAGTQVDITQSLGGAYTVQTRGGLFRIARQDADALGMSETGADAATDQTAQEPPGLPEIVEEKTVWDVLKTCYDPEIPVNIVDLGLVYDLNIEPLPSGRSKVAVKMTLTAPGCGMGATIAGDAQQKLLDLPGVDEAEVEIVWEPAWHHSMITAEGRRVLGLD